jgi:hypothetical protein
MEQINTSKINDKGSGTIMKKLVSMMSFNEDAVNYSKDWPYLWQKENVQSTEEVLPTPEELASRKARKRRFIKMGLWGIVSLLMYLAIFLNQGMVTEYFTRGGFFSLAIVGTALSFALVHGTFTGHILEDLNYKAANREKDEH